MKKLLLLVPLFVVWACTSLNTNLYNAENTAVDTVSASGHTFNLWYANAVGAAGADTNKLATLAKQRATVYGSITNFYVGIATVNALRMSASSQTNSSALQIALQTLSSEAANIQNAVQFYMSGGTSGFTPMP